MVLRYLLSALVTKAQVVGKDAAGRALRSRTVQQIRQEASRAPGGLGDLSGKARRIRDSLLEAVRHKVTDASRHIKHRKR